MAPERVLASLGVKKVLNDVHDDTLFVRMRDRTLKNHPCGLSETLVETARVILQCPISHSYEEGIIMDIVQYLLDAKRSKHALWGHFHSAPWPPSSTGEKGLDLEC